MDSGFHDMLNILYITCPQLFRPGLRKVNVETYVVFMNSVLKKIILWRRLSGRKHLDILKVLFWPLFNALVILPDSSQWYISVTLFNQQWVVTFKGIIIIGIV